MPRQFGPSKAEIKARESVSADELAALAEHRSSFVRSAVARNAHTPAATLGAMADADDKYIRHAVASNPNTPGDVLLSLAQDANRYTQQAAAANPSLPQEGLGVLAASSHARVAAEAASNPATAPDLLEDLSRSEHSRVRQAVAGNLATPEHVLVRLARDPDADVAYGLAGRNRHLVTRTRMVVSHRRDWRGDAVEIPVEDGGRFSPELLVAFAGSSHALLHKVAAAQPDAPEEVLARLARHEDLWIRVRVAENPASSEQVLLAVLSQPGPEAFRAVAGRGDDLPAAVVAVVAGSRVGAAHAVLGLVNGEKLLDSPDPVVRASAANCFNASMREPLARMLDDEDETVRVAAAKVLPASVLVEHASHSCKGVRALVAERVRDSEALRVLAGDGVAAVRRRVAKNEAAPADVLTVLVDDRDARVRTNATERFLAALRA